MPNNVGNIGIVIAIATSITSRIPPRLVEEGRGEREKLWGIATKSRAACTNPHTHT